MATMDQPNTFARPTTWDHLLSRAYVINWEVALYSLILLLAIFTRFYELGDRVMSHDESLHVYYSWRLYEAGDFQHTPLMHGPVIFHAVAFFYFLFGDNDFTARIYTAILGIGIVMFPILLRRWLGKTGAVLASIGLLISPMMMYYSRYIREDIPNIFFLLIMVWCIMEYIDGARPRQARYLIIFSAATLLMMASKETGFMYIAIFGSFLTFYWIMRLFQEIPLHPRPYGNFNFQPPTWQTGLGHLMVVGAAVLCGFLLGELLYYWQFAQMGWIWIILALGIAMLVRLMVLAWDTVLTAARTSHTNDILNVVLVFIAIFGVLIGLFGAFQAQQKDQAANDALTTGQQEIPPQVITNPTVEGNQQQEIQDLLDERNVARLVGAVGLVLFLLASLALVANYFLNPGFEDDADSQRNLQWLFGTVALLAIVLSLMIGVRWVTTSSFETFVDGLAGVLDRVRGVPDDLEETRADLAALRLVPPPADDAQAQERYRDQQEDYSAEIEALLQKQISHRHIVIDLLAILVLLVIFESSGLIATLSAGEARPGMAQRLVDGLAHTRSAFLLVMAGTLIAGAFSLYSFSILDIIKPDQVWEKIKVDEAGQAVDQLRLSQQPEMVYDFAIEMDTRLGNALLLWVGLPIIGIVGLVLIAALVKTPNSIPLPWSDILIVFLVALIVGGVLLYAERRSLHVEEENTSQGPVAADPNAEGSAATSRYNNSIIIMATLFALILSLMIVLWRLYFPYHWAFLNRQPIFDVLIIMGTLILPWISALPVFLAGYKLDAAPLPPDTVRVSLLVTGSWLALTAVIGVAWNWKLWLVSTAVFMGLFLFFFTTVFTNGAGVFTGMVGSLGYWLEQQDVRRGSQPQYYYTMLQVPVYEYMPLILASLAGIAGLLHVFDWRAKSTLLERETEKRKRLLAEAEQRETSPLDMAQVMQAQPPLSEWHAPVEESEDEEIRVASYTSPFSTSQADATGLPYPQSANSPFEEEEIPFWARPYDHQEELAMQAGNREWLGGVPFSSMLGYWAIIIFVALTYAGEKMPWLTTHITVPLILVGAWYSGRILEKISWDAIRRGGWAILLFLVPVFMVALAEAGSPLMGGDQPFQGQQQSQLHTTYAWLAAVAVLFGTGYFLLRMIAEVKFTQARRLVFAGIVLVLAVLTARIAGLAAFQNYDYPTEYLVYAHGGDAVKMTMEEIEYIADRTNQGYNLKVAYDDDSSWPLTWYLRHYNSAYFAGQAADLERNPSALEGAAVVIVGNTKNSAVEQILGDQYYRFDYLRLWWPMQEYFNLNYDRVANLFNGDPNSPESAMYRTGIWNIWWERDYEQYGQAQCVEGRLTDCAADPNQSACYQRIVNECATDNRYSLSSWPVSDRMYVYVDKEIAGEIWDAGVGGETVLDREPVDALDMLYQDIAPQTTFGAQVLSGPRALAVSPDGTVYVADTNNSVIRAYDANGTPLLQIGEPATDTENGLGKLFQPWGVAVDEDGLIYVADTWNHRVQVFAPDGTSLLTWGYYGTPTDNPNDQFVLWGPRDIEIDLDGNVLVADTGGKRIRVYSSDGRWLRDIGSYGSGIGQLDEPTGLAVNPVSGNIFVADTWNRRIQEFTPMGVPLRQWEVPMWFDSRQSPHRPYLAISPDGTLLAVSDMESTGRNSGPRVVVYDIVGTPLLSFNAPLNSADASASGIQIVAGLEFAPDGTLYVLDSESGRVLKFAPLPVRGNVLPVPRPEDQAAPVEDVTSEAVGQPVGPAENMPFSVTLDATAESLATEEAPEATAEATVEATEEAPEATQDVTIEIITEEAPAATEESR